MKKRLVLLFGIIFLIISEFSFILATPTQIATCRNTDCFLTIPRHKIFQSQTNPNEIWLIFPGPGTGRYDNFMKTNDGGATWNTPITIKAYLDYHSSLDGDSAGNLYLADSYSGGAYFRKINYP